MRGGLASRDVGGAASRTSAFRRQAILDAALELFRHRGFHAVGIDEIGTAAGISGPGVYRHFPSKDSLLVALFDHVSGRLRNEAREIAAAGETPDETLDRLVRLHAAFATQDRALLALWIQDWRSLPDDDRHRVRRLQVEYMQEWMRALGRLRSDLSPREIETVVYAAVGTINSVSFHDSGLAPEALEPLLARLALRVLKG